MDLLVEYSPSQQESIRKSDRNHGVFAGWYRDVESVSPVTGKEYPRFDIDFGSSTFVTRLKGEKCVPDEYRYKSTVIYGKGTIVTFSYNGKEDQRMLFNDSDVLELTNTLNLILALESV